MPVEPAFRRVDAGAGQVVDRGWMKRFLPWEAIVEVDLGLGNDEWWTVYSG
jgi:hypothetical protein